MKNFIIIIFSLFALSCSKDDDQPIDPDPNPIDEEQELINTTFLLNEKWYLFEIYSDDVDVLALSDNCILDDYILFDTEYSDGQASNAGELITVINNDKDLCSVSFYGAESPISFSTNEDGFLNTLSFNSFPYIHGSMCECIDLDNITGFSATNDIYKTITGTYTQSSTDGPIEYTYKLISFRVDKP